jgi:site-specific recombinase XerC
MNKLSTCISDRPTGCALPLASLEQALSSWYIHGRLNAWSERTLQDRRWWTGRLCDFLSDNGLDFTADAIRLWLLALQEGKEKHCNKPLRPQSLDHVHRLLRAFCQWCVDEDILPEHPMRRIPMPINRDERVRAIDESTLQAVFDCMDRVDG